MSFDFNELLNLVDGEEFDERPVEIEEFVTGSQYMDLPPLSHYQYTMIRSSTQIYRRETLYNLYGPERGEERWRETKTECIFQLGKGSGKDYTSTIACAYIVYLLLCLKNPGEYFNMGPGEDISILNIAINSDQARNVFFRGFSNRIARAPWFEGKYETKNSQVDFDKGITVYSGHSEREAWEGYNFIYVVLDEISGFALTSASGNEQAKTAQAIYDMYRASVDSRFGDVGKVVLLSFPRFKGDFIQQRYDAVVQEKEVVKKKHTFYLDPENPNGNKFEVEWDEDHIISYAVPKVFALKRPTWEVNPTKTIDDFLLPFFNNKLDALSRFACMPPDAVDAFFKDKEKINHAFSARNGINEDGTFADWLVPDDTKQYFVHVDLARVHDRAAVALAHVEKFQRQKIMGQYSDAAPYVIVDALRWWTPTKDNNVDFTEIREYILALNSRGFKIKLVTFDRWESADMMEYLNSVGIKSQRLSVAKKHYTDMALLIHEERLEGPDVDILKNELTALRLMPNDTVDHPRKGGKDLADAVCGAVYNAVAHTEHVVDTEIEVRTYDDYRNIEELGKSVEPKRPGQVIKPGTILEQEKPKEDMPPALQDYLKRMRLL